MATGDRGVVDHHVVVGEPADAVEPDLERNLSAPVQEPAVGAGRLDGDVAGGERLHLAASEASGRRTRRQRCVRQRRVRRGPRAARNASRRGLPSRWMLSSRGSTVELPFPIWLTVLTP